MRDLTLLPSSLPWGDAAGAEWAAPAVQSAGRARPLGGATGEGIRMSVVEKRCAVIMRLCGVSQFLAGATCTLSALTLALSLPALESWASALMRAAPMTPLEVIHELRTPALEVMATVSSIAASIVLILSVYIHLRVKAAERSPTSLP